VSADFSENQEPTAVIGRVNELKLVWAIYSPPHEEGWLRHQQEVGEAHLSAADGVVAHRSCS